MYLVSDTTHKPVAFFDHYNDAVGYICSWSQFPVRFAETKSMNPSVSTMDVVKNDRNETLGYIQAGITRNPDFIYR